MTLPGKAFVMLGAGPWFFGIREGLSGFVCLLCFGDLVPPPVFLSTVITTGKCGYQKHQANKKQTGHRL
jgi:hypothetical protein